MISDLEAEQIQTLCKKWVRNTPLACEYAFDTNLKIVSCSDTFARYANFDSVEELIGKSAYDLPWRRYADLIAAGNIGFIHSNKINEYIYARLTWGGYHHCAHIHHEKVFQDGKLKMVAGLFVVESQTLITENSIFCEVAPSGNIAIYYQGEFHELSQREIDVLMRTVFGSTAKEVGELIGISYKTVEFHLDNLRVKFNVGTKKQLINIAVSSNFFAVVLSSRGISSLKNNTSLNHDVF